MKFIIFHGAYGSPEGNWFPQLKESLEALGQSVLVPRFPTPEGQNLASWIRVFENTAKNVQEERALCFIGHSLAPLFILHVVNKYNLKLDSAIFVSPFLTKLHNPTFDTVNKTFYKENFDFEKLKKLIPVSYTLCSNNDPYVSSNLSIDFAKKLGSKTIEVKNGGHLNAESGFTSFPLVLDLCRERVAVN